MSNILDFGADPTGVLDSTGALNAALANAGRGGEIVFPLTVGPDGGIVGTYRIAPNRAFWEYQFRGEYNDAETRSTLKPASSHQVFLWSAALCQMRDLYIDADHMCELGIALQNAHSSRFTNVTVANAVVAPWRAINVSHAVFDQCNAISGGSGWLVKGCNASRWVRCAVTGAQVGLEIWGKGADPTLAAGASAFEGMSIEGCDDGVMMFGVDGASLRDFYIEAIPGVGVAVGGGSMFCRLEGFRASGGGFAAYDLRGSHHCSLRECGADGSPSFRRIVDDGVSDNEITRCFRLTPSAPLLPIERV